ncbi:MAG: tubulin-like doman-containing protein [Defluviitaleaceae bacterium]|nr:tubulin-like doman-containing protein [Defluviitaleaceae bacterium]MCL2262997.1 tubulin-like doman-containing protein [Defluviitaleaceae bacterium]
MKLSSEIKAELQALDSEYGGGISTQGTRTDAIDKPILIIGLGGTGAEALIRVKKSVNRHFKLGISANGRRLDKPSQIEYLALDSDDNMTNLSYNGMSFAEDEFLLLDNANLTSIYRNRETVFKDSTQSWIAGNLRLQQVKHGAGGIRQAGRLLLTINSNRVISLLTEKINRLTVNRKSNDLLYVFILAGCAGGTGSGVFIDVPYIVRKIAEQKGFETENIGMVFLPDVTLSDSMIDGSAALNIKANGFAALKELDYLMNIERNGDTFEQTFADLEIKSAEPPYDLCHLVSAKDEHGKLVPAAKNYCMNVAAETIINFIASEEVTDGQSYTISSYLSNIENNKAAFLMTHSQKQPVNYIYNTIGASSASLPVEYLLNFLASKMFAELEPLAEKSPTIEDSKLTLETFKIDLPTLERVLTTDKPKPRSFKQYDHIVLQQRPEIIEDAIKSELNRLKDHYDTAADAVIASFTEMLADKNNAICQDFSDLERGPFYTLRLLSDLHETSVNREIDTLRKRDILQKREHRDSLAAMEISRQALMVKLLKKSLLGMGKKSLAENIVETSENYLRANGKNLMYDAIDRIYESVIAQLSEFNEQTLDTHCETLNALKELFDKFKNAQNAPDQDENFAKNLANAKEFCEAFEKDEDATKVLDYKQAIKRLLKDMLAEWNGIGGAQMVDNLNEFVTAQFQTVVHKSLDHYCNLMASTKEENLEEYITGKINELHEGAKVMFPINHVPSGLHIVFPPYSYLSVPHNAPQIRTVVRGMNTSGRVSNIKASTMSNRLYMLNLKIAVPLYCYTELNEYEAVYETSLNKIAGLHLYECPERNWKELPSPNYDKLWTTDYENTRERLKNNRMRDLFDCALDYKIIRLEERTRCYFGFYGDRVNLSERFSHIESGIEEKTLNATQARAAMAELNEFLADAEREKYFKPLFDTEYLAETDTPDVEYAKGVFIYMPRLCEYVANEVRIREYIEALRDELSKIDLNEVKYSHFAQMLYMGVISKSRKTYRYTLDGETQILHTMQNITEQFVDYDVFKAYLELPADISAHLQKHAQEEENQLTDDQFVQIGKTIDTFIESYQYKLELLEKTFSNERDGTLKRIFYRTMLEVFTREKEVLA